MTSITIQNLIKRTSSVQSRMSLQAVEQVSKTARAYQQLQAELSHLFSDTSAGVKKILADRNKTAADLPVRTRRAYQWAAYLSKSENLDQHLDALQRVNLYLPQIKSQARNETNEFAFYHLGPLYKITEKSSEKKIIVQECFIHAPDYILSALLETAYSEETKSARQIVRDYTFTSGYQTARINLEYLDIPPGSFEQGNTHHLDLSFNRVNQDYFESKISRPRLVWSSRLTYRKFGHYQWDIDTVMISQTLDHHLIPDYVVDYVMYHELLHKKLGARKLNGRRSSHTKKFRNEEQKFKKYEKAKQVLNRLSRNKTRLSF